MIRNKSVGSIKAESCAPGNLDPESLWSRGKHDLSDFLYDSRDFDNATFIFDANLMRLRNRLIA